MSKPLRGVYLITPDLEDTAVLLSTTRRALSAGVALLQYRNKRADRPLRCVQAAMLLELCRGFAVPLIINDDPDLAQRIGSDGVHLGGEDAEVSRARAQLGAQALIGASCYSSLERAREAKSQGASYLAFGAFACSPTKPLAARAEPGLLTRARDLALPIVAIGGISPSLAPALVHAGADLLAVISAVYAEPDPAAAVLALRRAFPEFEGISP
jgi:thiamine-phosphate pyrophosphorylase